jgi:ABC-type oligopeptide transport system, periplasmic component
LNSQAAIAQVYEGLYTTSKTGKVIPGVATKVVKPTNGGKTYTITLRKDAKWSNGKPVTAQDFVYSFQRQVDPKTKSQEAGHVEDIENAVAINSNKKPVSSLGVKALSKTKLQIKLAQPTPYFDYRLATELYPLNKQFVNKYGSKYGSSAKRTLSNGPFNLEGWTGSNDTWSYEKNNRFHAAKGVRLKTIKVQTVKDNNTAQNLFSSNDVQITAITGNQVQADQTGKLKKNLVITKQNSMSFIVWNSKQKATKNTNLRRAVSYAINRQTLVKNVLKNGSIPAKSMVAEGDFTNSKTGKDFNSDTGNLYPHDVKKAKQYWQQAQKELGEKQVHVTLLTSDMDVNKSVGEYIQGVVQQNLPGLKISLQAMPLNNEIATFTKGNFEAGTLSWTSDFRDPIDFLNKGSISNSINFGKFNDPQYEKLIKTISEAKQSETDRYQTMQQAAKMLADKQGVTPLYQGTQANLISTKVGGAKPTLLRDTQYRYAYWK